MEEIEFVYSEGVCKIFHNGELKHQLRVARTIFSEWKKILLSKGYSLQSESNNNGYYYAKYIKK